MDFAVIGGADRPTVIFISGGSPFFLAALAVLAFFYAIYFAKMFAQKKRGIRTRQLGKRREKDLRAVEILLSIATFSIVPIQLLSMVFGWSLLPGAIRIVGAIMGLIGDMVFLIAVLHMRDSWRAGIPAEDKTELVSDGIYKFSRNPAFLGFDLMYTGILLMYFNPVLLLFTVWAVVMLHLQILQEEKFLQTTFGQAYMYYKKHTARYLGRR